MPSSQADFQPTATWAHLRQRSAAIRQLRTFFEERHFVEVETPILSRDTVVDRYLNPIGVAGNQLQLAADSAAEFYLQTSPEFGMKRLLAAGATAIFQICKSFRSGERGAWHNPEFTMLEWYETQVDYAQGQQRLLELIAVCFPQQNCRLLTYRGLFQEVCEIDPFAASLREIEATVKRFAPETQLNSTTTDRDGLLNLLMGSVIEDELRRQDNVVLIDWPASQAALSQTRQTEYGEVGERFEWYHRGIELANGYHELLDPTILRQRNLAVNQLRRAQGDRELPVESRLLQAMEAGLPASCGCALGVDRLVACLLGATSIDQVIAFPWERA